MLSPMKFVIDKTFVQPGFNNDLPPLAATLSYRHDFNNLQVDFVKKLTEYDVTKKLTDHDVNKMILVYKFICVVFV